MLNDIFGFVLFFKGFAEYKTKIAKYTTQVSKRQKKLCLYVLNYPELW